MSSSRSAPSSATPTSCGLSTPSCCRHALQAARALVLPTRPEPWCCPHGPSPGAAHAARAL
eukprot:3580199-Prymnesium_polylepis.1